MQIENYLKHIIENPYSAIFYTPSFYDESKTYLFTEKPDKTISADQSNFHEALKEVDGCVKKNYSGYGFINYKAGYLLEEKLKSLLGDNKKPLMKFFFYEKEK
ncbi:MAG TPA: hypothetical protein VLN45_07970, partial [Ignavibacteriaceae bacterium]|nr:hypothetical protein [Ignavibacteriaceae bacterium]